MFECSESDGSVTFAVRVVPRASRTEVVGEHDGALKIRVPAPPVEGAANEELTRFLARQFGVPVRAVAVVSGHSSRTKRVRARGATAAQLRQLAAV